MTITWYEILSLSLVSVFAIIAGIYCTYVIKETERWWNSKEGKKERNKTIGRAN